MKSKYPFRPLRTIQRLPKQIFTKVIVNKIIEEVLLPISSINNFD